MLLPPEHRKLRTTPSFKACIAVDNVSRCGSLTNMNVFRHDDVSQHYQAITLANPLQNLQNQITVSLVPGKMAGAGSN